MRVETGPSVIIATRLDDPPPSIVRGDVLRDADGRETPLRALAFGERGEPIANAPIRYYYVPTLDDSTAGAARDQAIVVDSIEGTVRANDTTTRAQAVVAVRVGGRLQLLDTIQIVRRPDSATAPVAVTDTLRYDCTDDRLSFDVDTSAAGNAALRFNASRAFGVTVLGDSAGTFVGVPARLVRWTIVEPANLPFTRLPRGAASDTVPPLVVADSATGGRLLVDTTATSPVGRSAVRLRIRPTGLGRTVLQNAVTLVRLRGVVQPGPRRVRGDTVFVTVPLRRQALDASTANASCQ